MTTKYLGRFFLMFAAVLAANCVWADDAPRVVPVGDNTYSITVKGTHKFTRNTQKLKDQAMEAARQFCAKEGKQVEVVSVKENKSMYLVGAFPQAVLTFKAVTPGATEVAPVKVMEDHPKPPPPPAMTADLLTTELTKLDDLRKKGLLTDEEFTVAKKKLLDRL